MSVRYSARQATARDEQANAASRVALRQVQRRRKLVLLVFILLAVFFALFTHSATPSESPLHEYAEYSGMALIVLCILGRTWASIYISGNKRTTIIETGPYSVVRNPLYLFSIIGAAGVGLMIGSAVFGFILALLTFAIFNVVVMSEEAYLRKAFGADFATYESRVRRWLPRLSDWRDAEWVRTRPANILTTFRDTCLFLLALPAFELIENLQDLGLLSIFFRIP